MARNQDWDAATYDRVSEPQQAWGRRVIEGLDLRGVRTALDVGCGTGRLTAELLQRLPAGRVIALDASAAMLGVAAARLRPAFGPRLLLVRGDASRLPLAGAVDLIFSAATFHWVPDHPRLFGSLFRALRPGGRLTAQCGGRGNLARLLARAAALAEGPYREHFDGWTGPWEFADAATSERRLRAAGFTDVTTGLEPAPVILGSAERYADFIACVCVRRHLERLPALARRDFVGRLTRQAAADDPPFSLDYWRLNLDARRPPA